MWLSYFCQIPRSQIHFAPPVHENFCHPKSNQSTTRNTHTHISCHSPTLHHNPPTPSKEERLSLELKEQKEGKKTIDIRKESKMASQSMLRATSAFFSSIVASSILPSRIPRCAARTQLPPLPRAPIHSDPLPCPHPLFFQPAYS